MNRVQFWILLSASSLIVILLLLQLFFARSSAYQQARLLQAQQVVNDGRTCEVRVRELAQRIYQVSQQTQDQGLKDLLARQNITVTGGASSSAPAPAPVGTTASPANP